MLNSSRGRFKYEQTRQTQWQTTSFSSSKGLTDCVCFNKSCFETWINHWAFTLRGNAFKSVKEESGLRLYCATWVAEATDGEGKCIYDEVMVNVTVNDRKCYSCVLFIDKISHSYMSWSKHSGLLLIIWCVRTYHVFFAISWLKKKKKKKQPYRHGTVLTSSNKSCGYFAPKVHGSNKQNQYMCTVPSLHVLVLFCLDSSHTAKNDSWSETDLP